MIGLVEPLAWRPRIRREPDPRQGELFGAAVAARYYISPATHMTTSTFPAGAVPADLPERIQLQVVVTSAIVQPDSTRRSSRGDRSDMAEYGEWQRKGAVLSDVTAQKEYGVTRDFILKGVEAGELEFREGAVWGNPYLRVLRSQLERYIVAELGSKYLESKKSQTELHAISKEIAAIRKKLALLEARKVDLEHLIKKQRNPTSPVTTS